MKKTILFLSLLSAVFQVNAQEVSKTLFDKQSVTPTYCQIINSGKTPSCVISVGADIGTKLTASVIFQKHQSEYIDSFSPESANFETNDDYTVNPMVSSYGNAGNKQIRVIFRGNLTSEMAKYEQYGRLLLTMEKDGQQVVHNLPVFFKTADNQKPNISSVSLGVETIKSPKGMVNVPILKIKNIGNGVAAFSMVAFNNKDTSSLSLQNDFAPFNATVMPNSTAKIILTDKRVYSYFKNNPTSMTVINKKTLLIEKIELK